MSPTQSSRKDCWSSRPVISKPCALLSRHCLQCYPYVPPVVCKSSSERRTLSFINEQLRTCIKCDHVDSYCLSFKDDGKTAGTTLDSFFMQHHNFIFDVKDQLFRFAAAECPSHKNRPFSRGEVPVVDGECNGQPYSASVQCGRGRSCSSLGSRTVPKGSSFRRSQHEDGL